MGNTSSNSKHEGRSPGNSTSYRQSVLSSQQIQREKSTTRSPKRRESLPAVSHGRGTTAIPPASLDHARGVQNVQSASDKSSAPTHQSNHSRQRSQTATQPVNQAHNASDVLPIRTTQPGHQSQQSHPLGSNSFEPKAAAIVGQSSAGTTQPQPDSKEDPVINPALAGGPPAAIYIPSHQYNRPPRLPLPIEDQELEPGSPIISPEGHAVPADKEVLEDNTVARRLSVHSTSTVDSEDAEDEYQAHNRATGQMVDTVIEWKEGGEKVYVTGSFSSWNKKHRLHRNGPSSEPNALSTLIPLVVGAHHMTFLVDGVMRTSKFYPTAVDYTNVLINYIEVTPGEGSRQSAPVDVQQPRYYQQAKPTITEPNEELTEKVDEQMRPPPTPDLKPTYKSGIPSAGPSIANSVVPLAPENDQSSVTQSTTSTTNTYQPFQHRRKLDTKKYHNEIPGYLRDLDTHEDSHRFARAINTIGTQPTPPALPMFLNKSILNGTLPMKDDASVLVMPNHTVLNHLATTSIKSKILATSATTRYKRKYVTTVLYKPTKESGPS